MIETTYLLGAMFLTSEVMGVMRLIHANGIMHFFYLIGKSILKSTRHDVCTDSTCMVETVAAFLDDARSSANDPRPHRTDDAVPPQNDLLRKQGRTARHHARHHDRHHPRHHAHSVRHARHDRHVSLDMDTDS